MAGVAIPLAANYGRSCNKWSDNSCDSGIQLSSSSIRRSQNSQLYASQTGNAAERIGREAERRGCPASIVSTDNFDVSSLPHDEAVVFVVSTTGQGDSPDSFKVRCESQLQ